MVKGAPTFIFSLPHLCLYKRYVISFVRSKLMRERERDIIQNCKNCSRTVSFFYVGLPGGRFSFTTFKIVLVRRYLAVRVVSPLDNSLFTDATQHVGFVAFSIMFSALLQVGLIFV